MNKLLKNKVLILVFAILISQLLLYREVFFHNKILFPSNFLASFYSPWSTQKFPGYPNGIPNKPIGGNDQVRMFYPYRTIITESLKRGELPLWNPYNFSGGPLLANFQSAIFYPLNIIYLILPQPDAWTILVMAQPLLAFYFMYLLIRQLTSSRHSAILGAFAYGFSGFILAWSQENAVVGQTSLWFPLIVFAVEKYLITEKPKFLLLLATSLASCFLGGHHQFSITIYVVTYAFTIYRVIQGRYKNKIKQILLLTTIFGLSLGIAGAQLIPSLEAFPLSPRGSTSSSSVVENYLLPVTHFINAIAPDIYGNPGSYNYFGRGFYQEIVFYIGVIPLMFALIGIRFCIKNKYGKFFSAVAGISYILAVKTPLSRLIYSLPLIKTFTPSRFLFVTAFCLAIMAALGFEYVFTEKTVKSKKTLYILGVAMITLLIIVVGSLYLQFRSNSTLLKELITYMNKPLEKITYENVRVSAKNIVLPIIMILLVLATIRVQPKFGKILIISVTFLGQLYFLNKYLVLGNREFLYPSHFIFSDIEKNNTHTERFISFGTPILGNVASTKHLYTTDGIDPVFPNRYGELIYAAKNEGKYTRNIPRIEATLSEYSENTNIVNNNLRINLLSLLGVTRIYNYEKSYKSTQFFDQIFPPTSFESVWEKDGWRAYKNNSALPRAFLAPRYIKITDPQRTISALLQKTVDPRTTIILEEDLHNFSPALDQSQDTTLIKKYTAQKIIIETNSPYQRLLFLSDTFYPGWTAKLDGKPLKIYRANYAFRAVPTPSGKHTIIFEFKPTSVQIGFWLSGISIITLGILYAFMQKRYKLTN